MKFVVCISREVQEQTAAHPHALLAAWKPEIN